MSDAGGISLLLITGTMGAGKSTVMAEASDLLEMHHLQHAAIDVDTLGLAYLTSAPDSVDVMYANLDCVCRNYARLGVRRFLMVRSVETREELHRCRDAALADFVVVCRLTAGMATLQQRVGQREPGMLQAQFVARVEVLNAILDRAGLEDFTILNQGRSVTDVAREMLTRAGWLPEV